MKTATQRSWPLGSHRGASLSITSVRNARAGLMPSSPRFFSIGADSDGGHGAASNPGLPSEWFKQSRGRGRSVPVAGRNMRLCMIVWTVCQVARAEPAPTWLNKTLRRALRALLRTRLRFVLIPGYCDRSRMSAASQPASQPRCISGRYMSEKKSAPTDMWDRGKDEHLGRGD